MPSGSDSRGSWNVEPFRHAARSIVALRWTRPANGETKALPVGASVTDGASTFRLDVLAPLHPTFPNGIWGGRIAKNAGKTAVFPPPPPPDTDRKKRANFDREDGA